MKITQAAAGFAIAAAAAFTPTTLFTAPVASAYCEEFASAPAIYSACLSTLGPPVATKPAKPATAPPAAPPPTPPPAAPPPPPPPPAAPPPVEAAPAPPGVVPPGLPPGACQIGSGTCSIATGEGQNGGYVPVPGHEGWLEPGPAPNSLGSGANAVEGAVPGILGEPPAPAPGPQIAVGGGTSSGIIAPGPDTPPSNPGTHDSVYGGECNLMDDANCWPNDSNDPRIGVPANGVGECLLVRDEGCRPKHQGQ
jgi:hypothetical protein